MRVIGLTGSIASGKSTVSGWLQDQPGVRIIDGDLLSRELTAPGGAALPEIRSCFGEVVFYPDGTLNRRLLGKTVFSDPLAREKLDQLMSSHLQHLTHRRIQEAREEGVSLCFLDFPLLFEKGYDSLCDTVWCVWLPRSIQLQRLMARDGLTEEEAVQRIDAVLSSDEKASRSQVVIDNSGELAFTLSTLPPLLERERQLSSTGRRRRAGNAADRPEASVSQPYPVSPAAESGIRVAGSSQLPAAPLPSGSESPGIMERPASARRGREARKAAWRLPVWLAAILGSALFLVLSCLTAQLLMRAYLARQAVQHAREQRAILANYPMEYRDLIEAGAEEFNLNPAFVTAIIRNESSFQPRAESSVGARGLMQLMPDTAEWIAGKMKISGYAFERMYDPESNIRFGCWYLRYLASLFHGDPVCVACAYHAGQGQVNAWLSDSSLSQDGISLNLSKMADGPTKTYAGRVIRAYGIYEALYFHSSVPGSVAVSSALDSGLRQ